MGRPLTRILSDLHYRDGDCRLRELRELGPLCEGVDHLIFNGDCLDTQRTPAADFHTEALRTYIAERVPQSTFITGNHDPVISSTHTLHLAGKEIFVFHGDILFDAVAPWSSIAPLLRAAVLKGRAEAEATSLQTCAGLFAVHRRVCREIHVEFDVARADLAYRVWRNLRALLPPQQFLTMLRVWRNMPSLAADFTQRFSPESSVVVVGHSHAPSVTKVDSRWVINTGSFCRPRGQLCVDISDSTVSVRRVKRGPVGFTPLETVQEIPLAKSTPSA